MRSGGIKFRRPQRYDPEMQYSPHNRSSAGDRSPFIVSGDQELGVFVLIPTKSAVPQMLVDIGVNCSFTQVEFVTDFSGRKILINLNHFIHGDNGIIGDNFVCLARILQI